MSVSIYFLRRFGLKSKVATTLSEDDIELLDLFLEYNPKLSEKYTPNKQKKLKEYFLYNSLETIARIPNVFDELYLLESNGTKVDSNRIYKQADTISELSNLLDVIDWKEKGLLASSKKARIQIDTFKETLVNHQIEIDKWKNFRYFLENTFVTDSEVEKQNLSAEILQDLADEGFIIRTKDSSGYILAFNNICYIEELKKYFNLNEDYYIEQRPSEESGGTLRYTLDEFLLLDIDNKSYFEKRISGKTLREIGDEFGVSQEWVRLVLKRIVPNLPRIVEVEEYSSLFTEYDISLQVFKDYFCSDGRVYELLSLLYRKGDKDIAHKIASGNFTDDQKKLFLHDSKLYLTSHGLKELTRENAVIDVLYKNRDLQKYLNAEELFYLYSEEIQGNSKLTFSSVESFRNQLERYQNIIFSLKNGFRYHNLIVSDQLKSELKILFQDLEDGTYSMHYIFERNPELMLSMDIRDGSELHYFCKKYQLIDDVIKLGRNPEFTKGEYPKRYYVQENLLKYNRKSLDEFLSYMYDNFGLQIKSLAAYLSSEFSNVIINRIIFFESDYFDSGIQHLRSHLNEDVYEKHEFYEILTSYIDVIPSRNDFLIELGYVERGELVVKIEFKSAYEALSQLILSGKTFKIEQQSYIGTPEYYNALYTLEKEMKILKISEDTYINTDFLEARGYQKENLKKFVSSVENTIKKGKYFTIVSLINEGFQDKLIEDGFDLISLDRLISTSEMIKAVSLSFPTVYVKDETKRYLNEFLIDNLVNYESVNVEDFTDDINSKYGINLDEYDVQRRLISSGAFYSKELNKVYISKEDYLDEVYGK